MRGRASGDEASGRQSHRLVGTGDLLAQRCRMGGVAAAEVPHVPSTQACRRRADKGGDHVRVVAQAADQLAGASVDDDPSGILMIRVWERHEGSQRPK